MRLLMLGAGGVGGYFGARLHVGGADVSFLVRAKRAALLRERGLRVHGARGEFQVHDPKLLVAGEAGGEAFDAIVLSCKAYDLRSAIDSIRPFVGAQTLIVPLLNGIVHLDTLDAAFGPQRVMGGLAKVSATIDSQGDIKLFTDTQDLTYGPRAPEQAARVELLDRAMQRGGFNTRLSPDILAEMWEKFVLLTSLAAMTCMTRANVGELAATQDGARLMSQMLDICAAVAKAEGYPPRANYMHAIRSTLTQAGSPLEASMRRDLEGGGPTEADHIVGDMLRRADKAQIEATLLRAAYCHLEAYERRRRQ